MLVRLFKWVKCQFPFIWCAIERINGLYVSSRYGKLINKSTKMILDRYVTEKYIYREITKSDITGLSKLLLSQPEGYNKFFNPHKFDEKSLLRIWNNGSYLMLGVFEKNEIIGYFFIRFFANRQAFRGNFVDYNHQGKGIGSLIVKMMTEIGLSSKFRVFATVSKENISSMASTKAYNKIKIIKELPDNDVLIEHIGTN